MTSPPLDQLRRVYAATRLPARASGFDFLCQRLAEDDLFVRLWPRVKDLTLLDPFRAKSLLDLLIETAAAPGDVIECGVARGGMALLLALALAETGSAKRLVLCDTFRGLPAPDPRFDRGYGEGHFAVPLDAVLLVLARAGVEKRCELVPGLFAATLPRLAGRAFSLVHLDGDLYASTRDGLRHLHPLLSAGCPLVLDDYYDESGGVERAAAEHLAGSGEALHLGPTGQAFFFKDRRHAPGGPLARLARLPGYLEFVRAGAAKARSEAEAMAALAAAIAGPA